MDIGIRPRQVFEGTDVNLFPFTKAGIEWLRQNIQHFTDPVWSQEEHCLKLSSIDSTINLPNVIRCLRNDGLRIKFYGRLEDQNENIPELDGQVSTLGSNIPRTVIVSAIIQIALLVEPMWRAIKLETLVSIVGTSIIVTIGSFFILQASVYRKTWARNGLALLALLSFIWAVAGGDLFAIDHLELRLAAATSIPNLLALALLYTPAVDRWFKEGAHNKATKQP